MLCDRSSFSMNARGHSHEHCSCERLVLGSSCHSDLDETFAFGVPGPS